MLCFDIFVYYVHKCIMYISLIKIKHICFLGQPVASNKFFLLCFRTHKNNYIVRPEMTVQKTKITCVTLIILIMRTFK